MKLPTSNEKFNVVIDKNTFFYYDQEYEDHYEAYISSVAQNIFILKNKVETKGLDDEILFEHITKIQDGIDAILTITGLSKESLQRLVTYVRVSRDGALEKLVNKDAWPQEKFSTEWSLSKIKKLIMTNSAFAHGMVNLFLKGSTVPAIKNVLPLFEYKKLDINKFSFSTESLIDTIIRYKTKGAYKATKGGNPEKVLEMILSQHKLPFGRGKFKIPKAGNIPRTMDFLIPNTTSPKVIIECSYSVTTASGMGDKAKTETVVAQYLKKHYPSVIFVGFVDGVGWFVRRGDLKRMVAAYDYVFTFSGSEVARFSGLLKRIFYAQKH